MSKSYSELIQFDTFEERFRYLKLDGIVGETTFGFDRYLNQVFYNSPEWKRLRNQIIVRDNGCDLGVDGYLVRGKILIHHINPITIDDIKNKSTRLFDLDNLISTCQNTHNAIHYGDESLIFTMPIERTPNDTCPWKH